jgi:GR25 family glycosyltransferase involved in LPS biosynthesis
LERRLDRKQKLQPLFHAQQIDPKWIKAVDGKQLTPTDMLKRLVDGNTFNSRRGVIGCALSHLNIWKQLVQDPKHDFYIVLEDDIDFQDGWYDKLTTIQRNGEDLIWLGYSMFSHVREQVKHIYDVPADNIIVSPFESKQYVGGTFSYLIYKSGAQKIIDYIQQHGIKRPIDNLMVEVPILQMKEIRPFLFHTEWYEDIHKPIDSDIQMINDNLFMSNDLSSLLDQFIFIPNLDQIGNDLYVYSATLTEQLTKALQDEKCIAFNTLGYFKYALNHLSNSSIFKEKDGIFLKKSRVKIQQR